MPRVTNVFCSTFAISSPVKTNLVLLRVRAVDSNFYYYNLISGHWRLGSPLLFMIIPPIPSVSSHLACSVVIQPLEGTRKAPNINSNLKFHHALLVR